MAKIEQTMQAIERFKACADRVDIPFTKALEFFHELRIHFVVEGFDDAYNPWLLVD